MLRWYTQDKRYLKGLFHFDTKSGWNLKLGSGSGLTQYTLYVNMYIYRYIIFAAYMQGLFHWDAFSDSVQTKHEAEYNQVSPVRTKKMRLGSGSIQTLHHTGIGPLYMCQPIPVWEDHKRLIWRGNDPAWCLWNHWCSQLPCIKWMNTYTQDYFTSCWIKPNLDCNYTFMTNWAPNRIPFGSKYIGKCNYDPNWFDLTRFQRELPVCVPTYIDKIPRYHCIYVCISRIKSGGKPNKTFFVMLANRLFNSLNIDVE